MIKNYAVQKQDGGGENLQLFFFNVHLLCYVYSLSAELTQFKYALWNLFSIQGEGDLRQTMAAAADGGGGERDKRDEREGEVMDEDQYNLTDFERNGQSEDEGETDAEGMESLSSSSRWASGCACVCTCVHLSY